MLMHGAPAVSFQVRPSRLLRRVGLVWCLFALGVQGLWYAQSGVPLVAPLGGALLTVGLAAWAWREVQRGPRGVLTWDGAAWSFTSDATAPVHSEHALRVVLDAQRCLLLCWPIAPPRGAKLWFFVERDQAPAHWHALRCAVYSRAATRPLERSLRT